MPGFTLESSDFKFCAFASLEENRWTFLNDLAITYGIFSSLINSKIELVTSSQVIHSSLIYLFSFHGVTSNVVDSDMGFVY